MRYFVPICAAIGMMGAASCGRTHKDKERDTYIIVGGGYCTRVTELQNTCGCNGPRGEFPNRIIMNYLQEGPNGEFNGVVDIDGGGFYFGAFMTKDGYLSSRIEDFEGANPMIDRVVYSGVFTGTNDEPDFATRHDTVGPEGGEICEDGKPCHFRIEYHAPYCCNGKDGYNVIALSGEKVHSTVEAEACVNGSGISSLGLSLRAVP